MVEIAALDAVFIPLGQVVAAADDPGYIDAC